jgi:hypothetical protein
MTIANQEHLSRTREWLAHFEAEIGEMRTHLADNPNLAYALASHERMCQQLREQIRFYETSLPRLDAVDTAAEPICLKGRVENGRLVLSATNPLPVRDNEIWVAGRHLIIDLEEAV